MHGKATEHAARGGWLGDRGGHRKGSRAARVNQEGQGGINTAGVHMGSGVRLFWGLEGTESAASLAQRSAVCS